MAEVKRRPRVTTPEGDATRDLMIDFMREYQRTNKCLPTISELASKFSLNRNAIRQHLEILRRQKRVTFVDNNLARTLRLR